MTHARLSAGQRQRAADLLATHGDQLWRIAVSIAGNSQEAEDLLAATLARALEHLDAINDDKLPAYLRRAMLNARTSAWRRNRIRMVPLTDTDIPDDQDPAELAQLRTDIAAALKALPPRQRAVIVLRYLEDRPVAEVATLLGCGPSTVRSQTLRALTHLRRIAPQLLTDGGDRP